MALTSWYHADLNRFVKFAEESAEHMERMGWIRKDDPADDVISSEAAAGAIPSEPLPPPPVGDDIVQGALPGETAVTDPADETSPEVSDGEADDSKTPTA